MKFQVIKRDGSVEEYSETKIIRVVLAAGLKKEKAQQLATVITQWLKINTSSRLSSLQLREKVINELKKMDIEAYNFYNWYEKTKDDQTAF